MARSVPFGAFAPAELYDMRRLQAERPDADYFRTLTADRSKNNRPQLSPPTHILQLHPGTLRRGSQADPAERINTYLGDSLPEIIKHAYDHPAANLLTYGLLPGVPMDFLNALMQAPWSFIRNTDDRYGVKVAAEEAYFLD